MSFVFSNIPICGKDTIEQYIMTLIAGGDLGYREKLSSLADPSQPFSPPSDDSILLWRHLAISHLLLASRAAADGDSQREPRQISSAATGRKFPTPHISISSTGSTII